MGTDTVLTRQDVVAKNGVVTAMGPSGTIVWEKDALVVDAGGKFLMPGLAEMHAHIPPENDLEPMHLRNNVEQQQPNRLELQHSIFLQ